MSHRALPVYLGLASSLLSGCQTGHTDPGSSPSGALARCIGEPGYDVASVKSFLDSLNRTPGRCAETGDAAAKSGSGQAMDSAEYQGYVFDSQCRFVTSFSGFIRTFAESRSTYFGWDQKDAQGRPVLSGEYFINTEIKWAEGGKDTTYGRLAFVRTCDR